MKKQFKQLKITIKFNKGIAKRFSNMLYYKTQEDYVKNLSKIPKEKVKYSTPKTSKLTKLIDEYKKRISQNDKIWQALRGVYRKNQEAAKKGQTVKNQDLLGLLGNVNMLIVAYRTIRRNKGALTLAAQMCKERYNNLTTAQKVWLAKTSKSPDGISLEVFRITAKLLRQGQYPWGSSRRIYIDKPGQPKVKRPITIPPFMDRIVQEGMRMILECIYEPYFEKRNRSFGFRPRKGAHDCIYCLTRSSNNGLRTAIEGDIKSAYDKVARDKLIEILAKRIEDRKFLNLIRERLDYTYYDSKYDRYIKEEYGIPQGGIDSPYLWNIYMHEFDEFVHSHLESELDKINKKVRGNISPKTNKESPSYSAIRWKITSRKNAVKEMKCILKNKEVDYRKLNPFGVTENTNKEEILKKIRILTKEIKGYRHKQRQLAYTDPNKAYLRFTYTRYADDWIIVGNFPPLLAKKFKKDLADWLETNLKATLSVEKTLVTDMLETPAHFLGFELRARSTRKLNWAPNSVLREYGRELIPILKKVAGQQLICLPDRTRLINRQYMKGYCDKKGFPRELPWLSTLEGFTIIERYNAVLRGVANYYADHITTTRGLYRWLYIIRFSCLKTLAQKYKTSISGIFKRFRAPGPSKTIQIEVTQTIGEKVYKKVWRLLTQTEAIRAAKLAGVRQRVMDKFELIEKGHYESAVTYQTTRGATPRVIDKDFLDQINWVNLRTSASLDLLCYICSNSENVEMHHIKHVRKRKYSSISDYKFWEKVMALRNRKQIPVCRECHMKIIHKGEYVGTSLSKGIVDLKDTKRGYDNRLINIENFINPSKIEYYGATLEEKGWKVVQPGNKQESIQTD